MIDRVSRMTGGGNTRRTPGAIRGTVASGMVRGLLDFAVSRGASEAALLGASGVDRDTLNDADARLPLSGYVSLLHSAQQLLGCEALALQFGESMSLASLSVVGLLSDAAPTMRESLARMNRYASLLTDTDDGAGAAGDRFVVTRRGAESWLVDHRPTFTKFPEQVEMTFAFIATTMRRYARNARDSFVHEVQVSHLQPRYVGEYTRIFGVPVSFGLDWNALRIDASWLDRPLALQPAWAADILEAHAERQLVQLRATHTLSGRVSALLREALVGGGAPRGDARMLDVESLAKVLHMSRATLARQLRDEGTSFTQLGGECRRELAEEFLGERGVSVKEAAFRLGFSDPAAFSRAYKRWTGVAPATDARARG